MMLRRCFLGGGGGGGIESQNRKGCKGRKKGGMAGIYVSVCDLI